MSFSFWFCNSMYWTAIIIHKVMMQHWQTPLGDLGKVLEGIRMRSTHFSWHAADWRFGVQTCSSTVEVKPTCFVPRPTQTRSLGGRKNDQTVTTDWCYKRRRLECVLILFGTWWLKSSTSLMMMRVCSTIYFRDIAKLLLVNYVSQWVVAFFKLHGKG